MYDTLMQMGRWFGYRHGYEDLVRVHTTPTLIQWYSWLVRVEDEVAREHAVIGEERAALAGQARKVHEHDAAHPEAEARERERPPAARDAVRE